MKIIVFKSTLMASIYKAPIKAKNSTLGGFWRQKLKRISIYSEYFVDIIPLRGILVFTNFETNKKAWSEKREDVILLGWVVSIYPSVCLGWYVKLHTGVTRDDDGKDVFWIFGEWKIKSWCWSSPRSSRKPLLRSSGPPSRPGPGFPPQSPWHQHCDQWLEQLMLK